MKCNTIAQRISLQEFLIEKSEEIQKEIQEWLEDEEKIKTLNRETVD
jgi:hypothetical protein